MLITDSTPQTDALAQALAAGGGASDAALRALQGARELEGEVMRLRLALADMPASARQDPAWREQLACLLSKVVLFRVALADPGQGAETGNVLHKNDRG
ncbi:MAG: hypothetical protein V4508_03215 [Pseudomonadota bacterium]